MNKFTLAVANKLTDRIKGAKEHFSAVEKLVQERERVDKTPPKKAWFRLSCNGVSGSDVTLVSDWLPMKESVIMKIYLQNVTDEIQALEVALEKTNDETAGGINSDFELGIGMVAPSRD